MIYICLSMNDSMFSVHSHARHLNSQIGMLGEIHIIRNDIFRIARTAYSDMDSIRNLPYTYLIISLSRPCPSTRYALRWRCLIHVHVFGFLIDIHLHFKKYMRFPLDISSVSFSQLAQTFLFTKWRFKFSCYIRSNHWQSYFTQRPSMTFLFHSLYDMPGLTSPAIRFSSRCM